MEDGIRKPPSERGVAAVSRRDGILIPAGLFPCRTSEANMKMIIMAKERADLAEP
jgi:hypothetical protein